MSSLWICDDRGRLYVLTDISGIHCSNSPMKSKWIKVDSGFKNVYAGHRGLVCGIKDCSLYIRKGITHNTPMGTDWVVCACDVLKVMAGKTCIVRKSSRGHLYVAKVNLGEEVLDWKPIPPPNDARGDLEQMHYAVDEGDRLFSVTGSGTVFCCELLLTRELYWYPLTGPPNLESNQSIYSMLSNFWSSNGDANGDRDWISQVSFGFECLWCLREGTKEVWQLVIGWLNSVPKTNWTKLELPLSADEESVVALTACKSTRNGLCVIAKGEGYFKIVSCLFSSAGSCDRVEVELPTRCPCRSIALCSNPTAMGITPVMGATPTVANEVSIE